MENERRQKLRGVCRTQRLDASVIRKVVAVSDDCRYAAEVLMEHDVAEGDIGEVVERLVIAVEIRIRHLSGEQGLVNAVEHAVLEADPNRRHLLVVAHDDNLFGEGEQYNGCDVGLTRLVDDDDIKKASRAEARDRLLNRNDPRRNCRAAFLKILNGKLHVEGRFLPGAFPIPTKILCGDFEELQISRVCFCMLSRTRPGFLGSEFSGEFPDLSGQLFRLL